jgi:hypothetical protein
MPESTLKVNEPGRPVVTDTVRVDPVSKVMADGRGPVPDWTGVVVLQFPQTILAGAVVVVMGRVVGGAREVGGATAEGSIAETRDRKS